VFFALNFEKHAKTRANHCKSRRKSLQIMRQIMVFGSLGKDMDFMRFQRLICSDLHVFCRVFMLFYASPKEPDNHTPPLLPEAGC